MNFFTSSILTINIEEELKNYAIYIYFPLYEHK
jgi:hypothetical protein